LTDLRVKPFGNERMKSGQQHQRHLSMHRNGALPRHPTHIGTIPVIHKVISWLTDTEGRIHSQLSNFIANIHLAYT
jgi:hypothetical protein